MSEATESRDSESTMTMDHLTYSMSSIAQSSQETQKIIKTIDEIAFQTNLLALNATVDPEEPHPHDKRALNCIIISCRHADRSGSPVQPRKSAG